jgi:hypothetical protein
MEIPKRGWGKAVSSCATAIFLLVLVTSEAKGGTTTPALSSGAPALTAAQPSVSMILHHVLTSKGGQQYFLNASKQAFPLPGAGVADGNKVVIYTGSGGQSWYVDKTGKTVDLTPAAPPQTALTPSAAPVGGSPSGEQTLTPGSFSIDNQVYGGGGGAPPDGGSTTDGTIDETTAAQLALTANAMQAAADMAESNEGMAYDEGVPYDEPLYWGAGGSPYWWGADGVRHDLARTVGNGSYLRNWGSEQDRYQHEATSPFGRYFGQQAGRNGLGQKAFAHPESIAPFHSLFSQPMLSGLDGAGGLGDGWNSGRYTGRDTGRDTGRYTGRYTGRPAGSDLRGLANDTRANLDNRAREAGERRAGGGERGAFHGRR